MVIVVDIKVVPNSGKQRCELDKTGKLKCSLKSQPEKGKANQELIKLLSQKLSLPQQDIKIIRGATTRTKSIQIKSDYDLDTLLFHLGIEKQTKI